MAELLNKVQNGTYAVCGGSVACLQVIIQSKLTSVQVQKLDNKKDNVVSVVCPTSYLLQ